MLSRGICLSFIHFLLWCQLTYVATVTIFCSTPAKRLLSFRIGITRTLCIASFVFLATIQMHLSICSLSDQISSIHFQNYGARPHYPRAPHYMMLSIAIAQQSLPTIHLLAQLPQIGVARYHAHKTTSNLHHGTSGYRKSSFLLAGSVHCTQVQTQL